jgi:hypothetical protein
MQSADKDVATAGLRAFGRIGRKPAAVVKYPSTAGLSAWQVIEHMDSRLRYADAQVAAGNHAEAMAVYRTALEAPQEHWQCAAIIGIAGMRTAQAAAAIFPKLKSPNRKVRMAAQHAWRKLGLAEA